MFSFRNLVLEKPNKKVGAGWTILKLDDESELSTNMKLIDNMEIQISSGERRTTKTHKLKRDKGIVAQIEKILGQKLDMKDTQVFEFIELYP